MKRCWKLLVEVLDIFTASFHCPVFRKPIPNSLRKVESNYCRIHRPRLKKSGRQAIFLPKTKQRGRAFIPSTCIARKIATPRWSPVGRGLEGRRLSESYRKGGKIFLALPRGCATLAAVQK